MTVAQTLGQGRLSRPLSEMRCFPDTVLRPHPTSPHTESSTVQMYTCVLLSVAVPFNRNTPSAGWSSDSYISDAAIVPANSALDMSPKPIRLQALYLTRRRSASTSSFMLDIAYHPHTCCWHHTLNSNLHRNSRIPFFKQCLGFSNTFHSFLLSRLRRCGMIRS